MQVLEKNYEEIRAFNYLEREPEDEVQKERNRASHARWRERNRDYLNAYRLRHEQQSEALSGAMAHRKGVPWSPDEDGLLMEDSGLSLYQRAVNMGRSWRECKERRRLLRAREAVDV